MFPAWNTSPHHSRHGHAEKRRVLRHEVRPVHETLHLQLGMQRLDLPPRIVHPPAEPRPAGAQELDGPGEPHDQGAHVVGHDLAAEEVLGDVAEDLLAGLGGEVREEALGDHEGRPVVGYVPGPARLGDLERPERVVLRGLGHEPGPGLDDQRLVDIDPADVGALPHAHVPAVETAAEVEDRDGLIAVRVQEVLESSAD